jgi:dihydroxyacetone kinase-like protein
MDRGMTAVISALETNPSSDAGALFKQVGMTLVSTVGGASGPLFGTFFLRLGTTLGEVPDVDPSGLTAGLRAGLEGVVARGRAEPGDKTMYDALAPAVDTLELRLAEGDTLTQALQAALVAAEAGRDATIPMVARKGRASYLGERSRDHQDPGATSSRLIVQALADVVNGR